MIKGIYGINVVVKDFEQAVKKYEEILNVKPVYSKKEDFAFPNLKGARFSLGETYISVIASETDDTNIAKFLQSRGEGVFLVSLLVDDIENDVKTMEAKGVKFISTIKETPNVRVAWAHPKSMHGVEFEILQLKK